MNSDEIVREPMIHDLKCWPEYYEAVARGYKTFEVRKWDRPYRVGDTLWLREWDNIKLDYTGRSAYREITYILDLTYLPGDNVPHFSGYCVMGMQSESAEIERLKEVNKALESDNYNAEMNLAHITAQLAESQRREKAAVEDMKIMALAMRESDELSEGCCFACIPEYICVVPEREIQQEDVNGRLLHNKRKIARIERLYMCKQKKQIRRSGNERQSRTRCNNGDSVTDTQRPLHDAGCDALHMDRKGQA